jgi:hypothetical protein
MRTELSQISAIMPRRNSYMPKMFSAFPEHLSHDETIKSRRLQNAFVDHENLQKRTEKARKIKELRLVKKEDKIMGKQATALGSPAKKSEFNQDDI